MRNSLFLITSILFFSYGVLSQEPTVLALGKQETFLISPNGEKRFSVQLKQGDFADVFALASADLGLVASVFGPEGEAILEGEDAGQSVPFIATKDGRYVIVFSSKPWNENQIPQAANQRVTVSYANSFKPQRNVLKASKKLNGYDLKILAEVGDSGSTYFIASKGDKLKGILKRPNAPYGGFYFKDDIRKAYTPAQKRSSVLFGSTLDKTGNGVPDVAVEYYSGGAHCCFEITFFELSDELQQIGPIETANDSLTATRKKATGGLQFVASEQTFAYWAISFAGSPMPLVIFDIKDGVLTPNFESMKKPAPSLRALQQKAEAARLKINTNPYTDPIENFNDFEEAFWGEMLDLIYTGHEDLAWQYFDLVWPAAKPGKAKFLSDFRKQLSESYWGEAHPQKVFSSSNLSNESVTIVPEVKKAETKRTSLEGAWRIFIQGENPSGAATYLTFKVNGADVSVSIANNLSAAQMFFPVVLKDDNFSFSQSVTLADGSSVHVKLDSTAITDTTLRGNVTVTRAGVVSTAPFSGTKLN